MGVEESYSNRLKHQHLFTNTNRLFIDSFLLAYARLCLNSFATRLRGISEKVKLRFWILHWCT